MPIQPVLMILGGVFVAVAIGLYFLLGPITGWVGGSRLKSLHDDKQRIEAENAIRQTLIHAAGGMLLAGTLAATAIAAKQSFETLEAQRDAQVTDRYAKAVESLGHDNAVVKAAAIFALGRIAKDSTRDRDNINQAISAFVRDGTERPPKAMEREAQRDGEPAVDVDAAMRVLGQRDRAGEVQRLRLEGVYLANARMHALKLPGTFFNRANLAGVQARGEETDLRNVDLSQTILHCADFSWVDLSSYEPKGTALTKRTNLKYAELYGAKLQHADLRGAMMQGAKLASAHLEGADLSYATGLDPVQLSLAFTDDKTVLPTGMQRDQDFQVREYDCWN
ncbi:pentapeptide repeat-containing protein [Streptomyces sp. NPDC058289]|uniref:pentapeptide repeat-containing protein n=1 Tax=Streptomyces sp. NPDC058289 TaxID=3346425 RepID=UPI0036E95F4C